MKQQATEPQERPRPGSAKFYAGGAIIAVTILGLVMWAMNRPGSTAFYLTTSEVAARSAAPGEQVRINGNVVPGTVDRDGLATTFVITDGSTEVTVHTERALPDSFRDVAQTEIVALGSYDGQRFNASEVLAKCPSKFRAKA